MLMQRPSVRQFDSRRAIAALLFAAGVIAACLFLANIASVGTVSARPGKAEPGPTAGQEMQPDKAEMTGSAAHGGARGPRFGESRQEAQAASAGCLSCHVGIEHPSM